MKIKVLLTNKIWRDSLGDTPIPYVSFSIWTLWMLLFPVWHCVVVILTSALALYDINRQNNKDKIKKENRQLWIIRTISRSTKTRISINNYNFHQTPYKYKAQTETSRLCSPDNIFCFQTKIQAVCFFLTCVQALVSVIHFSN